MEQRGFFLGLERQGSARQGADMQINLKIAMIDLTRQGLYVRFRKFRGDWGGGFVIKPAVRMWYSERYGGWRGKQIGRWYIRTYERREILAHEHGEPK